MNVNGTLFFRGTISDKGNELMKSDGTEAGTTIVKDLSPGTYNRWIDGMTNVSGTLFFFASPNVDSLKGLWKSDGTDTGTKHFAYFSQSPPFKWYTVVSNKFFFALPTFPGQLWVSDGSVEGTRSIKNINNTYLDDFKGMNGILYFTATDSAHGTELWRSDGTDTGTYLVKDINLGAESSSPTSKTVVNGQLFFLATNNLGNRDLWKTNGTAAGTVLIKTFGNEYLASPENITNINNTLFFNGYTAANGYELWKSDGTTNGTILIKDIFSGIYSSAPAYLTNVNNACLFSANDGNTGTELWFSDGTSQGTHLVKDINQTTTSSSFPAWSITPFKNKIYFGAYTPKYGNELWVTDGTEANTSRVTDIEPGSLSGVNANRIINYFTSSNKMYFEASTLRYGNELWATDGISSNMVKDITSGRTSTSFGAGFFPGIIGRYCSIDTTTFFLTDIGKGLWETNGTDNGTTLLRGGLSQGYVKGGLTVVGKNVFFVEQTNSNYYDLWKTDGTVNGTIKINNAKPKK